MRIRLLGILCLFAAVLVLSAVSASAADVVDSGTCGEVYWTFTSDGTLTLSGSGSTKYYMDPGQWPWDPYHDQIKSVMVQNGVHIGRIFEDFDAGEGFYPNLTTVTINARDSFFDVFDAASFGFSPFRGCNNLQEINVVSGNEDYSSVDGLLCNGNRTALYLCPAGKSTVEIPNTVGTIYPRAFQDCKELTSITIPDNVERFYGYTFQDCTGLTSVKIGAGLNMLYVEPFQGADNITSIQVAEGNQQYTALDNVLYNKDMTGIAFCPETKTSIVLPASLTKIPSSNVLSSKLEQIAVDPANEKFTSVDGILYNKDKTELLCCPQGKAGEVTVPDGVTSISGFSGCSKLTRIALPASTQNLSWGAFKGCTSLTSMAIPDGLTKTSEWFRNCTSLTSVTIPVSLTQIDWYTFHECTSLKDVYYLGTKEQWEKVKIEESHNEALLSASVHFVPGDGPILSAALTGGEAPELTVKLFYDGTDPAAACFCFYDGNGRQLGAAETMDLPMDEGVTKIISAPVGTMWAKAFVINTNDFRPLCACEKAVLAD